MSNLPMLVPAKAVDRSAVRLADWLYDNLKGELLEGRYAPGDKLSVEQIRGRFGVSKQPVMVAMGRLASDGLVRISPQIGCKVASYDRVEAEDFFLLFGGFEATIAGLAAQRRTTEQLEALDAVSARVEAIVDLPPEQRAHRYRLLNREFHRLIHEMANSRITADASQRMWDLSDFLINTTDLSLPMDEPLAERQADHQRIRDALADGDGAAARREMAEHLAARRTRFPV